MIQTLAIEHSKMHERPLHSPCVQYASVTIVPSPLGELHVFHIAINLMHALRVFFKDTLFYVWSIVRFIYLIGEGTGSSLYLYFIQ